MHARTNARTHYKSTAGRLDDRPDNVRVCVCVGFYFWNSVVCLDDVARVASYSFVAALFFYVYLFFFVSA